MLIDKYLPDYQFTEHHQITIDADWAVVYDKILSLKMGDLALVRWLLKLRGIPKLLFNRSAPDLDMPDLTLRDLHHARFILLEEEPPREVVLGIIGRFWTAGGDLQAFAPAEFIPYAQPGMAKAAWNFYLEPRGRKTILHTETRILCLDRKSRHRFGFYWMLIQPFSGWIRRMMLREIQRRCVD